MWLGPQFGFGHVFRSYSKGHPFDICNSSFCPCYTSYQGSLWALSLAIFHFQTQQLSSGVTLPLSDLFSCLLSEVLENHFFMSLSHLYSTSDKTVIPVVHAASLSPISPCWEFSVPRSLLLAQPSSQGITWCATQTGSIQWELKQGPYGLVA